MNDNSYKVIDVDINEILPNRFQPRIQFDEEEILELSDSIKEHGVIQPIVVRTIGDKYEIIAGERRYKASVLAGKETVPVIIKNLNDRDSAELALIENVQRKNLTPIEEALSYKKILDMGYLTQETLASKIGKSQSSVANKIRLLNLSDEVQEALLDNKISERHARSLLRLKSISDQNKLLEKIITQRLTVRKTDQEIDEIINEKSTKEIEEGNVKMDNSQSQVSNIAVQSGSTFDIFGTQPVAEAPVAPIMPTIEPIAPVAEVPVAPIMPTIEPIAPVAEAPVAPIMPTIEPIAPVAEAPVAPIMPTIEPIAPVAEVPVAPIMPTTEPIAPVAEAPVESTSENLGLSEISEFKPQTSEEIFTVPSLDSFKIEESSIPTTQPIIEPFNMNQGNKEGGSTIAQTISEPIIITDYNKQYDPVMPTTQSSISVEKIDFKEIINAIRECSNKIEKYGYKIELEEYDLSTLYQVVFKIEK